MPSTYFRSLNNRAISSNLSTTLLISSLGPPPASPPSPASPR